MQQTQFISKALLGVSILAMTATQAIAQDSSSDQPYVDEIIVVGTAGGKGVDRVDASFAVTTFDASQLATIAPKSTADLLKSVPGVWAESSGGVAGANIDVRGLPGGGDAPFVSFAVNGSPLYGANSLSFFEGSSIFRIDETVKSVEALRGGPNAVFAKGEPGATINFGLKEGSDSTEARVKYTTSDYNLQRFDGVLSGALAEDLYYMVGGYVQASPGIRDAEFTSEKGWQISGQLTKVFDQGEVNVYTRITDDHGQWYLPFAYKNSNLDAGTFSQLGNATRLREIQVNSNGDTEVFDFADGRGWDGQVTGANIEFDLGGGFTLRDNVNYVSGKANTLGFVPAGSAISASALAAEIGRPVTTQGGLTLGNNELVQTYGHWIVEKDLDSFSNDLSINKNFAGIHDVTVGLYQSSFGADDWWSLGNPIPVHNTANGDLLEASITPDDIANAGGNAGFAFGLASSGDAQVTAFYAANTISVSDRLTVDLGVRRESIDIDYTLDTGPGFPDGTRDLATSIDGKEWAYTGAVNFAVNSDLGLFARYSSGFTWPNFDSIRGGNQSVQGVNQLEGGVKYQSDFFDVYGTVFSNSNDAFSSVVGSATAASQFKTKATGIEIDGEVRPFENFSMGVVGTFQNAEIDESTTAANVGNTVLRQPDWQLRFTPGFDFSLGDFGDATIYGTAAFIGKRFGGNANVVVLPSFEKFDLGVLVNTDSGLFFQVHADNITDEVGLTEGDPRGASGNARPIFGRSVKFSVGYDF